MSTAATFRGQENEIGKRLPVLTSSAYSQLLFLLRVLFLASFSWEFAPSDSTKHGGQLRAKCTSPACIRDLEWMKSRVSMVGAGTDTMRKPRSNYIHKKKGSPKVSCIVLC